MAKCDICGKGIHFGNNVSHSNRKTKTTWNANIQRVKCNVNGGSKRLHVCTRCLRSGKVERA
ncbi:MAG: 50S ribosomal protein L28 [Candidatus Gastranaerophilales bacterium]|nr:50S ribosomal protein L28 [Candidatus Gastranaerophilales bacterium]